MSDYFERIAGEWRDRSGELAEWAMTRLVNRIDVWGRYLAPNHRHEGNHAITAPFRDERGKVFLDLESLGKHFRTRKVSGVLGVHSTSVDLTSRWLAIDIDLHEPEELSITPQGNFVAAQGWTRALTEMGFDPLLLDSNGRGGFHLLVLFEEPLSTESVHAFGTKLVADFLKRGLDAAPEIFPGAPRWDHYGDWLRLPGRHHTHDHYTRVWNDEPWTDEPWLEGHDAIDCCTRGRRAWMSRSGMAWRGRGGQCAWTSTARSTPIAAAGAGPT
jgi:putative DNA primase/helicase